MAFKGLFVGIDKYESPFINELSCAVRDAQLLYSLFSDNLEGKSDLIVDQDATKETILKSLNGLKSATPDDIVVIAFSGHGSNQHHLITYDTDAFKLDETALSLEELTSHFSEINAKQVFLILDCCFSGGAGAKVFSSPMKPRAMISVNDLLDALGGSGKVIFTASQAKEEAWENGYLKNGLLTYYFVDHLLLKDENLKGKKQAMLGLLESVSKDVQEESVRLGKEQHPTIRGSIDETLEWPFFEKGKIYQQYFPERTYPQLLSPINELLKYDFDQRLIDTWGTGVTELNELQLNAINHGGLLAGRNLLVIAPTSSGKTLIGELAALRAVQMGQKAIFLFPLKALVSDKLDQFVNQYGSYGIRTIRATGESTTDDMALLLRGKYDICLMTYEKFTSIALGSPYVLEKLGCVVVDEVQMITNETRGTNLEFALTLIKMKETEGIRPQIVALSAVVGSSMEFDSWLNAILIRTSKRPVPIVEGVIDLNGNYHSVDENGVEKTEKIVQTYLNKPSSQTVIIPLVSKLVSEGKQVIVFRDTRGTAKGTSNYLSDNLNLEPATDVLEKLPINDISIMGQALRKSLKCGVALHVSDLTQTERQVIESSFRHKDSKIRVIVATPTLAMGVNTPAEVVVISGLIHPGDVSYSVAEYKNMVGRAGRLGFSKNGESYAVALNSSEEGYLWRKYVSGQLEDLSSNFLSGNSDIRTVILRVIAASASIAQRGLSQEAIIQFIDSSFASFLERKNSTHPSYKENLPKAFSDVETTGLVTLNDEGEYCLTSLGDLVAKSSLEVESAIRVIKISKNLAGTNINDSTLIAITQICRELDDLYFPLNNKGAQKEAESWYSESRRQGVVDSVLNELSYVADRSSKALRAKRIVACLTWMSLMDMSLIEQVLTRHGGLDGAAGSVRSTASRTGDFVVVVASICENLLGIDGLKNQALRLQTRLETGSPVEIINLASECGTHLSRADYQKLVQSGFAAIETLNETKDEVLLPVLDNSTEKLRIVRNGIDSFASRDKRQLGIPEIPLFT